MLKPTVKVLEAFQNHLLGFFFLLMSSSVCGSLVKPTRRLDGNSFQGPSLATCCFGSWLRIVFVFGNLRSMLQVKGA